MTMKTTLVTLALVSWVVGQSLDGLPSCAKDCVTKFTSGSSIGGCPQIDAKCICSQGVQVPTAVTCSNATSTSTSASATSASATSSAATSAATNGSPRGTVGSGATGVFGGLLAFLALV
ncbi:hypothetical protein BJ170DRAFT_468852 [Xylariales sp. AK1849]|nr:hypothetical protein BJ170DRAFT_468852 [Xylariales sp. AK1849]